MLGVWNIKSSPDSFLSSSLPQRQEIDITLSTTAMPPKATKAVTTTMTVPDKYKTKVAGLSFMDNDNDKPGDDASWKKLGQVGIVEFKHSIHISQKSAAAKFTLDFATDQHSGGFVREGKKPSDPITVSHSPDQYSPTPPVYV